MPAPASRFTYPRSIQNDIADVLATCRTRVGPAGNDAIDVVTKELIELFFEHDDTFLSRADAWARRARYHPPVG